MKWMRTQVPALFAAAVMLSCMSIYVGADEPHSSAPAQPPASQDKAKSPQPQAAKQESKPAPTSPGTVNLTQPPATAKDAPKLDDKTKAVQRKPIVAPPGLLSRAPTLPTSTAPGLGRINLNRASLEQLQRMPGVGLTWAPRILAGRPYTTLGDLARDGIPFTTIDALSDQVELGP